MTKDFEFVKEIVDNTEWEETRNQLADLKSILSSTVATLLTKGQIKAIQSSIEDISNVQSLVIQYGYCTEEEVFGTKIPQKPAKTAKEFRKSRLNSLAEDLAKQCAKNLISDISNPLAPLTKQEADDINATINATINRTPTRSSIPPGFSVIELKTDPDLFDSVWSGGKPYEMRSTADRTFNPGDILWLREYSRETGKYSGRTLRALVMTVLNGPAFGGLNEGFCIMGLYPDMIRVESEFKTQDVIHT
jgi:hypothetical protein